VSLGALDFFPRRPSESASAVAALHRRMGPSVTEREARLWEVVGRLEEERDEARAARDDLATRNELLSAEVKGLRGRNGSLMQERDASGTFTWVKVSDVSFSPVGMDAPICVGARVSCRDSVNIYYGVVDRRMFYEPDKWAGRVSVTVPEPAGRCGFRRERVRVLTPTDTGWYEAVGRAGVLGVDRPTDRETGVGEAERRAVGGAFAAFFENARRWAAAADAEAAAAETRRVAALGVFAHLEVD
jgi:hypothetical protein